MLCNRSGPACSAADLSQRDREKAIYAEAPSVDCNCSCLKKTKPLGQPLGLTFPTSCQGHGRRCISHLHHKAFTLACCSRLVVTVARIRGRSRGRQLKCQRFCAIIEFHIRRSHQRHQSTSRVSRIWSGLHSGAQVVDDSKGVRSCL
jgi:hypothetical protein